MDGAPLGAAAGTAMTPMMAQYHAIRQKAGDALLFYRMGDFYELFFDDAVAASAALDITLTRRGKKDGEDIPMCGVPFHAAETYLARLIRKGFSVAICEQTESPAEAKKRGAKSVVDRDIVRVVTPGTLTEETLLDARTHNHLAALAMLPNGGALAAVDVSTGDVFVQSVAASAAADAVAALAPAELLVAEGGPTDALLAAKPDLRLSSVHKSYFDTKGAATRLAEAYDAATTDGFGQFEPEHLAALGAVLSYLTLTQIDALPRLKPPQLLRDGGTMAIDAATRRSLELTQATDGGRQGSLVGAIDRTRTASGARLLARWLGAPLTDVAAINDRLDAVSFFVDHPGLKEKGRADLAAAPDLARALSRLGLGRGGPRDLAALRDALGAARDLAARLMEHQSAISLPTLLAGAAADLEARTAGGFAALKDHLTRALGDDLPLLARDGGFLATGYNAALDEVRSLKTNARQVIAALEEEYRQETGIKALKIKHSKVLGYTVEVTAAHADSMLSAPLNQTFRHRQTLANAVRFTTPTLAELDSKIVRAGDEALALELELFQALVDEVLERHADLCACADALALIDVTAALAHLASEEKYVRPRIDSTKTFNIDQGRHPVVEMTTRKQGGNAFIPNSCRLGDGDVTALHLVTGPNMAGKSTFLRQNALLAILAQAGSYVPAAAAHIGVVDRLFSRVGASDDIARGRSTFMVEMVETAAILNQATANSLVILDEVGRGTSTFDGLSIAWAALEYLHDRTLCRGLFATHYHELTKLSARLSRVRNVSMAVREWRGDVVFLHEVREGAADRSYGIAVAKLAGLPKPVIARANIVLKGLEEKQDRTGGSAALPLFESAPAEAPTHPVVETLNDLDPNELSPREALDFLYMLKKMADEPDDE
ncbi:DNA mismatch repair protein MutS [Parvularcula sp. LCG005]|uniref:DNA mismatch repair protein MutS n=1 Tax=Parvularcula sp. LCG005 TaxID=3078805 RepID=UPI002942DC00|nr:DNA mismatch repair protein MutS [Parvularcula sp. LCG005]WOI53595.1 DNA mismatch repair protein MutS [Parvularcula sp. LCG005]